MTFREVSHPDDIEGELQAYAQVLQGKAASYVREKRYLRKDRSVAWVNASLSLVRDAAGVPKRFVGVIEDITYRKRMEQDLLRAQKLESLASWPEASPTTSTTCWPRSWSDRRNAAEAAVRRPAGSAARGDREGDPSCQDPDAAAPHLLQGRGAGQEHAVPRSAGRRFGESGPERHQRHPFAVQR